MLRTEHSYRAVASSTDVWVVSWIAHALTVLVIHGPSQVRIVGANPLRIVAAGEASGLRAGVARLTVRVAAFVVVDARSFVGAWPHVFSTFGGARHTIAPKSVAVADVDPGRCREREQE